MNNAINDTALLARSIKKYGFGPKAIDEYEAEMIPRAVEAVTGSLQNSLFVHDFAKLMESPCTSV